MSSWPSNLSAQERFDSAREIAHVLVDSMGEVISLKESNEIVGFTPTLSSQIPPSFAAHTFNQFRRVLLSFELLRTCALWDRPEENKRSLPTVVRLIDESSVTSLVHAEIKKNWSTGGRQTAFEIERENRERSRLAKATRVTNLIVRSRRMETIRNFRDKYLAHNLSQTRAEARKGQVISLPSTDSVRLIHRASAMIIHAFHSALSGADFDFDDTRRIAHRNASELWRGLSFSIR